jgi:hypothetical protein
MVRMTAPQPSASTSPKPPPWLAATKHALADGALGYALLIASKRTEPD